MGGEDALIAWLRRRLRDDGGELIGDDGAVVRLAGERVVTTDQQIAGVHFPTGLDPAVVGERLLTVNLSDLAAMGAQPEYAFCTLAVPTDVDPRRFFDGLIAGCRRHRTRLAGGDVARGAALAATLTLIGRRAPGGRWVRRAGARAGDRLWIGGTVGESAAGRLLLEAGATLAGRRVELPPGPRLPGGLAAGARRAVRRHLRPLPQLELGCWLSRRRAAAIDVSDGLARDLWHLCRESRVGATVRADALPLSENLERLAGALGADARRLALFGGEDYVLLFTLARRQTPPPRFGCRPIGEITAARGLQLDEGAGPRPLEAGGWDHLA